MFTTIIFFFFPEIVQAEGRVPSGGNMSGKQHLGHLAHIPHIFG